MLASRSKIDTRAYQKTDLERIYDIEKACFKDPYPLWLLSDLARRNPETFAIATAGSGQILVGYAVVDCWEEEYHLVSIAVHPDHRRMGVATVLLAMLDDRLSKGRILRLEVRESNDAAITFYSRHDFVKTGEITGYYADGETAITMEKILGGAS